MALEAQLQIVVDDAENLKNAYPGQNAEQIGEQQAYVVNRWETLQEKVTTRRSELIMAYDLQRLLAECKVSSSLSSLLSYSLLVSSFSSSYTIGITIIVIIIIIIIIDHHHYHRQ